MQVLPSTHNSPETAFVIDDYPFGSRLRCFKRIWVETAVKGAKNRLQRVVYQTTKRAVNHAKDEYSEAPMNSPHLWNKPKAGTYGMIQILFVEDETGHIKVDGLGEYPWGDHIEKFFATYGDQLDDTQRQRVPRPSSTGDPA